jgi:hypothetical protein
MGVITSKHAWESERKTIRNLRKDADFLAKILRQVSYIINVSVNLSI